MDRDNFAIVALFVARITMDASTLAMELVGATIVDAIVLLVAVTMVGLVLADGWRWAAPRIPV